MKATATAVGASAVVVIHEPSTAVTGGSDSAVRGGGRSGRSQEGKACASTDLRGMDDLPVLR